jgi:hypothetical protein
MEGVMIIQKNFHGLYASDVIDGRYQVLQSKFAVPAYYIFDHEKNDLKRTKDDSVVYYHTAADAANAVSVTPIVVKKTVVQTTTGVKRRGRPPGSKNKKRG